MGIRLEMTQQQQLSQKMIQSAKILQMSSLELENYLKETAVENPVVDIEEPSVPDDDADEMERRLEWLVSSDAQNKSYYSDDRSADDRQDMWNVKDNRGEDLLTYLESQLMAQRLPENEHRAAEYIINMIDSRGYFTEPLESVAHACGTDLQTAQDMLALVQSFDPAGVGARNLGECLLLQMDRLQIEDKNARAIAADYLELAARNHLPEIAKKLKISIDDVTRALEEIRSLNPKPGNSFSSRDNLTYIVPDISVVSQGGSLQILLNDSTYPRVTINDYYLHMIKSTQDKETKDYIGDKVRQAQWVMQCISQRNKTLMNVARVIVERQTAFFEKGPGNLLPLKLTDVADRIGVHESTVSRAVKDKYIQCVWGVFPMHYFFLGALKSGGDQAQATSDRAKTLIREIIAQEDHKKPYSDRVLAEKLTEKGVKISRRTVAKYRENMGIGDASRRKAYH